MIKHLARYVDDRRFPFQIANAFIYSWECDYWAMSPEGITREFEVKISRQDYLADAKKKKHRDQENGHGANYFYYVVPRFLIQPAEVDKRYGLLYVWDGGTIELIRKPTRLHNRLFTDWQMLANKMYWRYRTLWKEKYLNSEITIDQYWEGLSIPPMNS